MASELPEIIGLVGPIRAGKTTITKYLSERYGYTIASNSEILKRILSEVGVDPSRDNLSALGNSIFRIFGNDLIAKYRLDNLHMGKIIVDGIRYKEELARYRKSSSFRLLGVDAPDESRFNRAILDPDGHKDTDLTRSKFDQMYLARSELDVPVILTEADAVIYNTGSINKLFMAIDQTIEAWTR